MYDAHTSCNVSSARPRKGPQAVGRGERTKTMTSKRSCVWQGEVEDSRPGAYWTSLSSSESRG